MQDLDKIREALQDRVIQAVATATGINRNTLAKIKSGEKTTANKLTINALNRYLGLSDE